MIKSIFWPSDLRPEMGAKLYVIGYPIYSDKSVVIDLVSNEQWRKIKRHTVDMKQLKILGTLNYTKDQYRVFEFDYYTQMPIVTSEENLILFDPPNSRKLEYYTLDPIIIDIFWTDSEQASKYAHIYNENDKYSDRLSLHFPDRERQSQMKILLRYINLTNYIRSKVRPVSNDNGLRMMACISYIFGSIIFLSAKLFNVTLRRLCSAFSFALTYPLSVPAKNADSKRTTSFTLSDCSFALHQLNHKLQEFYNLPTQFQKMKNSQVETEYLIIKGTKFSPSEYIKFYNTVWLICNDFMMGFILHSLLRSHREFLTQFVKNSIFQFEKQLSGFIVWLMDSPAGFKLNNELAAFYGELCLWVMEFANHTILDRIAMKSDLIVSILIIATKYGGISMFVAIILDLVHVVLWKEIQYSEKKSGFE
ncbi:unnamed protein product [Ambrosiozyma monospora]|uniref:Unnamed protein product n=1 Tax=Ambrosiozyma monospora TaxID=43982 RepID=A0A9W7DET8_AMBMO|nr:unnamed protein product [Ambrosiozyma monospora]